MFKDLKKFRAALDKKEAKFWSKEGEKMALYLFGMASVRVPAYRDFLKINKINPTKIKTIADFSQLPLVNKKNYLLKYPLEKLCWDGEIASSDMISLSSGSSGKPFFWLRNKEQEQETILDHELFLVDSFGINKYSTLFIVSFSMGMWVAGTLTYRATQDIASRYKMTVITPGINKNDVLNIIKTLSFKYEQIIIAGYPPFVKDIVDGGETNGIDWKKLKVKFLFAAEAFSEEWRDHMYKQVGAKNPLKDSLNIYGTADALILGHETPAAILIRRLANKNKDGLYKDLFKYDARVPTLVQYKPFSKYFESTDGNLLFSAFSGIPLVRYEIGDSGDIIPYENMVATLKKYHVDLQEESKSAGISSWRLPFLYVYGRNDLTATLYGINIYPENIRDALTKEDISEKISGKFVMATRNDKQMNQYLDMVVELRDGVVKNSLNLERKIKDITVKVLKQKNNEYNELYKSLGSRAEPHVRLCQYGHKDYFPLGVKQRWHKKDDTI